MKLLQFYECDVCKKQSQNKIEILECEAAHFGLTLEEKTEYGELPHTVKVCGFD